MNISVLNNFFGEFLRNSVVFIPIFKLMRLGIYIQPRTAKSTVSPETI